MEETKPFAPHQSELDKLKALRSPVAVAPSIKELAELATRMPWEHVAPYQCRSDFRDAMTPELFLEMLAALIKCAEQLEMITGKVHDERCAWIDARAAIAKAIGSAS